MRLPHLGASARQIVPPGCTSLACGRSGVPRTVDATEPARRLLRRPLAQTRNSAPSGRQGDRAGGAPASASNTRDSILRAAGRLFAERGYAGTSTTQIAREVGIRQPSLYSHFGSKAEILHELIGEWLGADAELAERLAAQRELDAAARLYALIRCELEIASSSPYDHRGLFAEHIYHDSEFATEAEGLARWVKAARAIVQQGIDDGLFLPVEPWEVVYAIDGIFYGLAKLDRDRANRDPAARAVRLSTLLVRGLLKDVDRLDATQDAGERIVAEIPSSLRTGQRGA